MLQIQDLNKHFGSRQVLFEIGFEVRPGETVALLGKNGAGKTTIMNCIAGIIHPTSGTIRYAGESLLPESPSRQRFGILIDAVFHDYLDVQDNLRLLLRSSGVHDTAEIDRRIDQILTMVGLADQRKKKVRTFSFGMKQRLGLAQALMTDVDLLMLDEPLVGLDPPGRELFKNVLASMAKQHNKAVLFSSHELSDVAELCDRIVMIAAGRVIFDGPADHERQIALRLADLSPETPTPPGFQRAGEELLTTDPARINQLVASGFLSRHPIVDVRAAENSLLRLFEQ